MGRPSAKERRELERRKAESVLALLFKCARLANESALERARVASGIPVRPAHTALLPHIDLEGTRPTEIARRAGISKQAVGQLVAELEAWGALERVPDPADRRAWLVRFAHRDGRLSLFDGLAVLGAYERELAAALGPATWKGLARGLGALLATLEPAPEAIGSTSS